MYAQKAKQVVDQIKEIDVQSVWKDDHITCVGSHILFEDVYHQNVTFFWCGNKAHAALVYYDSPKSIPQLVDLFNNYIESELRDLEYSEEDESESNKEAKMLFDHFSISIE